MPIDKKHPPSFFPQLFRDAMFRKPGESTPIARSASRAVCKTEARRFRAFISSCQEYPLSQEYKQLLFVVVRTRVLEDEDGRWACLVFVKEKLHLENRINNAIAL